MPQTQPKQIAEDEIEFALDDWYVRVTEPFGTTRRLFLGPVGGLVLASDLESSGIGGESFQVTYLEFKVSLNSGKKVFVECYREQHATGPKTKGLLRIVHRHGLEYLYFDPYTPPAPFLDHAADI